MGQDLNIPVIWHSQEDSRGHYNCTTFINDIMDANKCGPHLPGWDGIPDGIDGAVIIVHGGREVGRFQKLQDDIKNLNWVFLIFLGDEEASFPAECIQHPNMIAWVQEPIPGRHDFAERYLIDGYTPKTKHLRKLFAFNPRDLEWVFAGQVTHERRRACVDSLRLMNWGGVIVESKGYCQGVSVEEYHSLLSRAMIVPCPSGPHSPDAARPWEALECGAIPILDAFSSKIQTDDYWTYVLGQHPLPVVEDWRELPGLIIDLKEDWSTKSTIIQSWWHDYKMKMVDGFALDLKELRKV